jgi:hypothetical protein
MVAVSCEQARNPPTRRIGIARAIRFLNIRLIINLQSFFVIWCSKFQASSAPLVFSFFPRLYEETLREKSYIEEAGAVTRVDSTGEKSENSSVESS